MKTTLFLVLLSLSTLQARTWTSITGQTAEAELVKVKGDSIVVKMADGRTSSFPIARLSEADQAFIKTRWQGARHAPCSCAEACRECPGNNE